ncbi:MAG: amidophosphoribosyltransferase [Candidatus Paceibacterota bacterium]|jgi:amidophosphoribosyltransferase
MLYLKGSLKGETNFDLRKIFPENCALAAAVNIESASYRVFQCLLHQEHRGESAVGIISKRGRNFFQKRRIGSVSTQFSKYKQDAFNDGLPGRIAIGHNRYPTQGNHLDVANVQPLIIEKSKYGSFAIAHNGTLVNVRKIEDMLLEKGAVFQSTTDTELLVHLIANSGKKTIDEAIIYALTQVEAAYSLLILTEEKLYAIRDRFGVRPLSVAKCDKGYLVCSETIAFDQFPQAKFLFDVPPGEMIIFRKGKKDFTRLKYAEPDECFCIFEGIYFSNPRTLYHGCYHEDFRKETGRQIALENPHIKGEVVIPILDSGKHAAIGLARELKIPYDEIFQRTHSYKILQSRSFTAPTFEERKRIVEQKLHLKKGEVVGKDIIVIDDSIVRSTTMKIIVQMLKSAGAKRVIVCIASPPITNVCPNGMDYQETSQIIAYNKTIEEIREIIEADELIYLSLQGLNEVVKRTYNCGICSGCFGGRYPIKPLNKME